MKNMLSFSAAALAVVMAIGLGFGLGAPQADAMTCATLSRSLSYGDNDYSTGGEVTVLQNFLVSGGFMTATPNGHFGPATEAGVKAFQQTYAISPIGVVGPLTRAAIKVAGCYASTVTTPTQTPSTQTTTQTQIQTTSQTVQTPAPITNPTPSASSIIAANPSPGTTLSIGDDFTVKWSGPAGGSSYNVILEDATGTPMGFIVSGTYNDHYDWKVGTVHNASTASVDTVPPGTYRVHVESSAQGAQSTDVRSGVFTIDDSVHISQIFPQVAPADGETSMVVYGSNFKSNSMIDIYGYGLIGPEYVSPDGKVIVFSVPTGVYPGSHSITVVNSYGGSDAKTESPSYGITVVRP